MCGLFEKLAQVRPISLFFPLSSSQPEIENHWYKTQHLEQGLASFFFFVKGQRVDLLGFAGHMVFTATTHLCHCNREAATDSK